MQTNANQQLPNSSQDRRCADTNPVTHHASAHPAPAPTRSFAALPVEPVCRWIAFIAGVILFVAVALTPPTADLEGIRLTRDRVLALEQTDLARLNNYRSMLTALEAGDPDTIRLVLASELQLVPRDSTALVAPGQPEDPRLFELLEPEPIHAAPRPAPATPSALTKLASDDTGRLILLCIAGFAAMWGIMPHRKS
ncbi:MAG: hypothetical protein AB8F26_00510 [Phycisphaerales bacterium]